MCRSFEAKSDLYLKILDAQEVSLVISVSLSLSLSLRTFCQRVQFNFCSTTDKFTGYMDERQRRKVESKRKRVSLSSARARNKERTMEFRYCANRWKNNKMLLARSFVAFHSFSLSFLRLLAFLPLVSESIPT